MNSIYKVILGFLCGVCFSTFSLAGPIIPDGWRLPVPSDYTEFDRKYFDEGLPNKVSADFNGDGVTDIAWILVSQRGDKSALFVGLGKSDGGYKVIKLDTNLLHSNILNMGISEANPGKYQTACGKGYWDCGENDFPEVNLELSGINYYTFESAASVVFWSHRTHSFERVWTSD